MNSRAVTYAQLAHSIRLSEPSVKRILSRGALTVHRLEQICRVFSMFKTVHAPVGVPRGNT